MRRELTFLSPSDPIEGMSRILEEHGIDALPVVDRLGRLVGAVVREDLPQARAEARESGRSKVRDWMQAPVTVGPKASLRLLCQVLTQEPTHLAFVVENERLVGVVAALDVVRYLAG